MNGEGSSRRGFGKKKEAGKGRIVVAEGSYRNVVKF